MEVPVDELISIMVEGERNIPYSSKPEKLSRYAFAVVEAPVPQTGTGTAPAVDGPGLGESTHQWHLAVRVNGGQGWKMDLDIQTTMHKLTAEECAKIGVASHVTNVELARLIAQGHASLDSRERQYIMFRTGAPDDHRGLGQSPSDKKIDMQNCGIIYVHLPTLLELGIQPYLGFDGHIGLRCVLSRDCIAKAVVTMPTRKAPAGSPCGILNGPWQHISFV